MRISRNHKFRQNLQMIIYSSLARVSPVHSNLALTYRSVQCSQIRANPFWLTLRERSLLSRHSKAEFNLLSRHRGTGILFCLKSSFKFRTTGPLFFLAATTFFTQTASQLSLLFVSENLAWSEPPWVAMTQWIKGSLVEQTSRRYSLRFQLDPNVFPSRTRWQDGTMCSI